MKLVIQRVNKAKLSVDNKIISEIGLGYLILVGIEPTDDEKLIKYYAEKVSKLRIFRDANGKTNLSIKDVGGEILAVSNFTLLAETKRTNRPSFSHAAPPEQALALYNMFCEELNTFVSTKCGIFGEHMHIDTMLDGPVTIVIDTKNP